MGGVWKKGSGRERKGRDGERGKEGRREVERWKGRAGTRMEGVE